MQNTLSLDFLDVPDDADRLRIRIIAWVVGVEALDVREQEEVVGMNHCG